LSSEFPPVRIERLAIGEAERLRAIRLRALCDAPDAFGTTLEEAERWGAEVWQRQLAELATFVAVAVGRDVGLVRGAPHDQDADAGYLISMWVAPEARRRGIGSALIDAVVQWAHDQALKRLLLDVGKENSAARSLYEKQGFIANGIVSTLPSPRQHIREIQMELRISR
jgi:ribosomal protein S18 acetylase RimI-like enzyme